MAFYKERRASEAFFNWITGDADRKLDIYSGFFVGKLEHIPYMYWGKEGAEHGL